MSESFTRRKALTYVVCAVVIALGLPAGAFAVVAGSNMFITDPATGHRAHVNTSGQLMVNAGGGTVNVGNAVRTNAFPTKPYSIYCVASETTAYPACNRILPTGETFVAQSISVECLNTAANIPVVAQVQAWSASTLTSSYTMVDGAQARDYSGYYETASELTGTEYLKGNVVFSCNGSRSGTPAYTMIVAGTAQGYLYP